MTGSGNAQAGREGAATDSAAPVPSSRRVTIQDVASEAGVSISAVSKVLRDAYGVSPAMRAKVTTAIERLGYRPHAGARGMRGRSYTIGVMLTDLGSPFQPLLVHGITDELEPTPFQEVLVTGGGVVPERQQRAVEALVDRQVDGLILITPWMSTAWLEKLGVDIPTVVIARHGGGENFDTVVDDDFLGAGLIVDHLVELGHERIVHTSQPSGGLTRPFVLSHTARCDGYVHAMKRHGLTADVIVTSYTEEGGYQAAAEALSRPTPPTAIFAGADIAALGVLRAAEERGLQVPADLSITGYDNIDTSAIGRISLTTVDHAGHLIGSISAKLVLQRLNGRIEPVHRVVAPRLVVRKTTAPPSAEPVGAR
jgi:LacI family transcriptional regulator